MNFRNKYYSRIGVSTELKNYINNKKSAPMDIPNCNEIFLDYHTFMPNKNLNFNHVFLNVGDKMEKSIKPSSILLQESQESQESQELFVIEMLTHGVTSFSPILLCLSSPKS
jgi:lipopolysaccharide assembly outer membrane protein LptD (OstA)